MFLHETQCLSYRLYAAQIERSTWPDWPDFSQWKWQSGPGSVMMYSRLCYGLLYTDFNHSDHSRSRQCLDFISVSNSFGQAFLPSYFCHCPLLPVAPPSLSRQELGDTLIFRSVQMGSSAVYQCNASNQHGYLLANAFVSVLGETRGREVDFKMYTEQ